MGSIFQGLRTQIDDLESEMCRLKDENEKLRENIKERDRLAEREKELIKARLEIMREREKLAVE